MHPFQVQLDAYLGDVAVHPVPPDAGLSARRRIFETAHQRVATLCERYRCSKEKVQSGQSSLSTLGHGSLLSRHGGIPEAARWWASLLIGLVVCQYWKLFAY